LLAVFKITGILANINFALNKSFSLLVELLKNQRFIILAKFIVALSFGQFYGFFALLFAYRNSSACSATRNKKGYGKN
jgi:hypothetical protein